MSTFDYKKYKAPTIGANDDIEVTSFNEGSDNFANLAGMFISFQHVPSQQQVYFKAFITTFTEQYNSNWASETVYGRVDPIVLFQNTQRIITLGFKIPAVDTGEAYQNLAKLQKLTQFLYPNYTNVQEAQTISQSPLVRLKVLNLLQKGSGSFVHSTLAAADAGTDSANALYNTYTTTGGNIGSSPSNGLLGIIQSVNIDPKLDGTEGVFVVDYNTVLPKLIEVNISFGVIHETPLGWEGETFRSNMFPYGALNQEDEAAAAVLAAISMAEADGESQQGLDELFAEIDSETGLTTDDTSALGADIEIGEDNPVTSGE